jgi:hypothetical protein
MGMAMSSRRAFFLLILGAASTVLAPRPALSAASAPAAKSPVTIQFPAGWVVAKDGLSAQAPVPDRDAGGSFQATVLIKQQAGTRVDAAAEQANIAKTFAGYTVVERPTKFTTKSGLEGMFFSGTYKFGLTTMRTRSYMFIHNGQIYTVTFTCLASKWPGYQKTIDDCAASLVIK